MDFPKDATTEDKIFLKQCYLDNLESMRSQDQDHVEDLREQMRTVKKRITETVKNIEQLSKEIDKVNNTKVD